MNADILEKIEMTPGRNDKIELISQFDKEAVRIIAMSLDPSITFGVTVPEDGIVPTGIGRSTFWNEFEVILGKLSRREITGNAAQAAVQEVIQYGAESAIDAKWASRIINRELRAGFDIRSLNAGLGREEVKKFKVQLAETYEPDRPLTGRWYTEPKLDGNRVLLIDKTAFSRSGKEYTACSDTIDQILKINLDFFDEWVLDGEMMGNLGFDQSSGALRRIDGVKTASFTYWVFDIIHRDDWEKRQCSTKLLTRKKHLAEFAALYASETIKVVPYKTIISPTHIQVMDSIKEYVALGFEGSMLKDSESPYVWKRDWNVIKAKLFHDVDVKVTGAYEGKGRHKGRAGGLIVDFNGTETRVGSGFSDDLRSEIWNDPGRWGGYTVQVQYQDVGSKGALRFPVFIMRRKDKEV
jgi:DNA ligase-1